MVSPPNLCPPRACDCDRICTWSLCRWNQAKMGSPWIRVDPTSSDWRSYEKKIWAQRHRRKKIPWRQRQTLEWYSYKPGVSVHLCCCKETPEAGKFIKAGRLLGSQFCRLCGRHGTNTCFWWGPLEASTHGGRWRGAEMCEDHMAREEERDQAGRFQALWNNQLSSSHYCEDSTKAFMRGSIPVTDGHECLEIRLL